MKLLITTLTIIFIIFGFSACTLNKQNLESGSIVAPKKVCYSSVEEIPATLSAVGYSYKLKLSPSNFEAYSNLEAYKAKRYARHVARLKLLKQLHCIPIGSNTTVRELMDQNSAFKGAVWLITRTATERTIPNNQIPLRTYETVVLEIDKDETLTLLRKAAIIAKVDKKN